MSSHRFAETPIGKDLTVSWEVRDSYSQNVFFRWGDNSPAGEFLVAGNRSGICGFGFSKILGRDRVLEMLKDKLPKAQFPENPESVQFKEDNDVLDACIKCLTDRRGNIRVWISGPPFYLKTWKELTHVQAGETTTYAKLAKQIDSPKGSRAVGNAMSTNPLSWLVPCHRVIRNDGKLGDYAWGTELKAGLLEWEERNPDSVSKGLH